MYKCLNCGNVGLFEEVSAMVRDVIFEDTKRTVGKYQYMGTLYVVCCECRCSSDDKVGVITEDGSKVRKYNIQ